MTHVRAATALLVLLLPVTPAKPEAPICAWPEEVGATALNVALPDTNARYWVMPYRVGPRREITVTGEFPDTRYASFTVYDGFKGTFTSNGVSSSRADYEISPDPGAVNPWQQAAVPGGAYTLHLRMAVAPGETNVLPLAPPDAADGQTGFLVYRIYLPTGGTGSPVRLPTLTFSDNGQAHTLRPCRRTVEVTDPGALAPQPGENRDLAFARTSGNDELFPNPDSGYLGAWVTPPGPGKVVVVRGKAASSPDQPHPHPWPAPVDDLRYWSLCTNLRFPLYPVVVNNLPDGRTDPGCRHDDVVALDDTGYYTFVIGTEAQRRKIATVPGATFVPFSIDHPKARHLVLLRNMMPAPGFTQSVLAVPPDGRPRSAATAMGDYYPRGKICALADLYACVSVGS